MLRGTVGGHRVIWSGRAGLLWAEGHPSDDGLLSPDLLPSAMAQLTTALLEADVPLPGGRSRDEWDPTFKGGHYRTTAGFAGVRRLDAACDLECTSMAEGLATLAGVGAVLSSPGFGKSDIWYGMDGKIETVYLRGYSGKSVLGRWYDKGLESGVADRGRLIRPEDQRRYTKGRRRLPEDLTSEHVRAQFQDRFMPLWRACKGVTVGGPIVLAGKILDAIEEERVTAAVGESIAGHMLLTVAAGRHGAGRSKRTIYRREQEMRKLGLVLADGCLEEVEVRLDDALEAALDAGQWAAG